MFLRALTPVLLLSAAAMAGSKPVCPGPAAPGDARCHAHVISDVHGNAMASSIPAGYGPVQFRTAYSLPSSTAGGGQTIAIVDAYNDPNIESDLAVYSSTFGLPKCTTANGCFKKVNQTGGTSYPKTNSGWALEISLDVEIAHALCPNCKILLVEATSNSFYNLLLAEDYARTHANVVSNSWGGSESSGETTSTYDGAARAAVAARSSQSLPGRKIKDAFDAQSLMSRRTPIRVLVPPSTIASLTAESRDGSKLAERVCRRRLSHPSTRWPVTARARSMDRIHIRI